MLNARETEETALAFTEWMLMCSSWILHAPARSTTSVLVLDTSFSILFSDVIENGSDLTCTDALSRTLSKRDFVSVTQEMIRLYGICKLTRSSLSGGSIIFVFGLIQVLCGILVLHDVEHAPVACR